MMKERNRHTEDCQWNFNTRLTTGSTVSVLRLVLFRENLFAFARHPFIPKFNAFFGENVLKALLKAFILAAY